MKYAVNADNLKLKTELIVGGWKRKEEKVRIIILSYEPVENTKERNKNIYYRLYKIYLT